jgi:hypothetical protein
MITNSIIEKLPKHLRSFIVDQHYERYTQQDHTVWRYVMRQNIHYLRKDGKILLLSFTDCTVKHQRKTLFEPSWGTYDMAVARKSVLRLAARPMPTVSD